MITFGVIPDHGVNIIRIKWMKDVIGNYHAEIIEFNFGIPAQKSRALILPPRGKSSKFLAKILYGNDGKMDTVFVPFSSLAKAKRWASKLMKRNAGITAA